MENPSDYPDVCRQGKVYFTLIKALKNLSVVKLYNIMKYSLYILLAKEG